jgi:hypothetical protein
METAACICPSSGRGRLEYIYFHCAEYIVGEKRGFEGSPSSEQQLFYPFKFYIQKCKKNVVFYFFTFPMAPLLFYELSFIVSCLLSSCWHCNTEQLTTTPMTRWTKPERSKDLLRLDAVRILKV